MAHEWKISDFCELTTGSVARWMVFFVHSQDRVSIVNASGHTITHKYPSELRYLDGCDSWDWQPPKPIEPPEGYRLLEKGEAIEKLDKFWACERWIDVSNMAVGESYCPSNHCPIARKIKPQVRPMTRDEFLAAWKQRGFCPLIDGDGDIDVVIRLILDADQEYDDEHIELNYAGWLSLEELHAYKFAFDNSPLTVEE